MVGHSIGGIYVRKYAALYPTEVKGLVLLDSAHEEQFARVSQISPEWAKRIHDRFSADEQRAGGFLPQGERLKWHFNGPLIVIEHEQMPPSAASDPMAKQSEAVFHLLQKDLAGRSKLGQLREAKKSGHYIQRDEPELVIQAIKDVLRSPEQVKKSNSQIPIATTITDLVHPGGTLAGKLVRVVASLHSDGIHTSVLLEPNCGVFEGTSKTPPPGQPQCRRGVVPRETDKIDSDSNYERLLDTLNQGERGTRDKHITAEFTGIFRCQPSCSSPRRFILEMEQVERVEVVWKDLKPHVPEK